MIWKQKFWWAQVEACKLECACNADCHDRQNVYLLNDLLYFLMDSIRSHCKSRWQGWRRKPVKSAWWGKESSKRGIWRGRDRSSLRDTIRLLMRREHRFQTICRPLQGVQVIARFFAIITCRRHNMMQQCPSNFQVLGLCFASSYYAEDAWPCCVSFTSCPPKSKSCSTVHVRWLIWTLWRSFTFPPCLVFLLDTVSPHTTSVPHFLPSNNRGANRHPSPSPRPLIDRLIGSNDYPKVVSSSEETHWTFVWER